MSALPTSITRKRSFLQDCESSKPRCAGDRVTRAIYNPVADGVEISYNTRLPQNAAV
jgi:hypothetical protein